MTFYKFLHVSEYILTKRTNKKFFCYLGTNHKMAGRLLLEKLFAGFLGIATGDLNFMTWCIFLYNMNFWDCLRSSGRFDKNDKEMKKVKKTAQRFIWPHGISKWLYLFFRTCAYRRVGSVAYLFHVAEYLWVLPNNFYGRSTKIPF